MILLVKLFFYVTCITGNSKPAENLAVGVRQCHQKTGFFYKIEWNDSSYHGKRISAGRRIMVKCSVSGRMQSSCTGSQEGSTTGWLSRQFHQTVQGHAKLYKSA